MEQRQTSKLLRIVGIALIIIAGLGFAWGYKTVHSTDNVIVAKEDVAAYTFASTDDTLEVKAVPEASVTESDLTEDEYNDNYKDTGVLITSMTLAGQRIDTREIAEGAQQSFAAVLPDERAIVVTAAAPGAVLGTIQPGDVVDVSSSDDGMTSESNKVICITTSVSGCEGVLPPGADLSTMGSGEQDGAVYILLASPDDVASSLAGDEVSLSLNTHCKFDREGYLFSSRDVASDCNAGDRLAGKSNSEDTAADEDAADEDASATDPVE